jgi:segregation and condensation protein A
VTATADSALSQPSTASPDAAWDDPPRRADPDAAPVLAADGFAAPLDWLLEMARARKIDLARLSIAALIASFATALEAALARRDGTPSPPLARWGDWLVMAATLAWLRSRLLLSGDEPEAKAAATEAEALRQQLLDRAHSRAAADWLARRPQLGRDTFARGRPEISGPGRLGDITDLFRACLVALRVSEDQAIAARPPAPLLWRVTDALRHIVARLPVLPDGSPLPAFLPPIDAAIMKSDRQCRTAVASTLVAGLELARNGALRLDQGEAWTEVSVHRLAGMPVEPMAAAGAA